MSKQPQVGISSCILGENVRYDGGAKTNKWVVDQLANYVELKGFCPEVSMGMGIPRKPIRIVEDNGSFRLIESSPAATDFTEIAEADFKKNYSNFIGLDGYIFMKDSPSCGPDRVKVYQPGKDSHAKREGSGLFYKFINENFPHLPYIDSGRLNNLPLRENFIKKVYIHHKFYTEVNSISELQKFHQHYKYTLMEYHPSAPQKLGLIASEVGSGDFEKTKDNYAKLLFEVIENPSNGKYRKNVMYHVMGYFKNDLNEIEKQQLLELIEEYDNDLIPYISIINMLSFFVTKYEKKYLLTQHYFEPYPKTMKLLMAIS
tara:strand:+ start:85135 stop:86082 length:948 start_codon:yes stop_codon:yes gene_type:complete